MKKKTIKKEVANTHDEELRAIAQEVNAFLKEKGVALMPFLRSSIHGIIPSVELVWAKKEQNEETE